MVGMGREICGGKGVLILRVEGIAEGSLKGRVCKVILLPAAGGKNWEARLNG